MKVVLLSVAKPISRSCIMNFILKLTNSWFVLFFLCPTISLLLLYFIYIFCFIKQTPRSKCWLKTKQVRDNAVTPLPPFPPSLIHFVLCYLGDTGQWQLCLPSPPLPLSRPLCSVLPRGYCWRYSAPRNGRRRGTPPRQCPRIYADGAKIQWLIMMAGRYKNQFETGTSGGALSSKARMRTEKVLFAGCYDKATGTQLHT